MTEYTWDHRNRLVKVTELDELGGNVTEVDYTYVDLIFGVTGRRRSQNARERASEIHQHP